MISLPPAQLAGDSLQRRFEKSGVQFRKESRHSRGPFQRHQPIREKVSLRAMDHHPHVHELPSLPVREEAHRRVVANEFFHKGLQNVSGSRSNFHSNDSMPASERPLSTSVHSSVQKAGRLARASRNS